MLNHINHIDHIKSHMNSIQWILPAFSTHGAPKKHWDPLRPSSEELRPWTERRGGHPTRPSQSAHGYNMLLGSMRRWLCFHIVCNIVFTTFNVFYRKSTLWLHRKNITNVELAAELILVRCVWGGWATGMNYWDDHLACSKNQLWMSHGSNSGLDSPSLSECVPRTWDIHSSPAAQQAHQ